MTDNIYFGLALFSTGVFFVQFVMSWIVADLDLDFDLDADGNPDISASDFVSFKGLVNFLIGFSWTMWFCREQNTLVAAGIAITVGLVFVVILGLIYIWSWKLQNYIRPESGQDLVGREGEVYLREPDGSYIIYVSINGSKRELKAYCDKDTVFTTGSVVRVSSYSNGKYYIY